MGMSEVLSLISGLCLFLFGMTLMGDALERRAGNKLKDLLGTLTKNKAAGFLTGLLVTSIIQSSSATTVMVVGFVNSGIMALRQAISVIMGANIGTTVTAWILSLGGISSDNIVLQIFKPTTFTPILALIGIAMMMFAKDSRKKDTSMILLGFATLMFGMDMMSNAVKGLADVPQFCDLFLMFKEYPILSMLAGAVLTAVIQSSSASVGILQALAVTGQVTYGAAIPIIMGQNIGTCITAILSSFGTNRNAKRAAIVHLSFNVIGTLVWITVFYIVSFVFAPKLFEVAATLPGIAVAHTTFNVLCTAMLLPQTKMLEKLAYKIVPNKGEEKIVEIDERLLEIPATALDRCRTLVMEMAEMSVRAFKTSIAMLDSYDKDMAQSIRKDEKKVDHYEDILGTYLVKLSAKQLSDRDSAEVSKILKAIGDFERISDHAVNVLESAEEFRDKNIELSASAKAEMGILCNAVCEIIDMAYTAFTENDLDMASNIEPLEQVIDGLRDTMRTNHIRRLQKGSCSIEAGFVLSDLLTNLERTADHCSNIAVCIIDANQNNMNIHKSLKEIRKYSPDFKEKHEAYLAKYTM